MDVAERLRGLRVALTLLEDGQHANAEALPAACRS
jgi:hypothetical protein